MTRILVADDHPLFRLALVQAARGVVADAVVDEAGGFEAVREALRARPDTDLVLLDLHMPGSHGLMGLVALRAEFPAVAVVMISANDVPLVIRRALTYGAVGFVPKRTGLDGRHSVQTNGVPTIANVPAGALDTTALLGDSADAFPGFRAFARRPPVAQ